MSSRAHRTLLERTSAHSVISSCFLPTFVFGCEFFVLALISSFLWLWTRDTVHAVCRDVRLSIVFFRFLLLIRLTQEKHYANIVYKPFERFCFLFFFWHQVQVRTSQKLSFSVLLSFCESKTEAIAVYPWLLLLTVMIIGLLTSCTRLFTRCVCARFLFFILSAFFFTQTSVLICND